MMQKTLKIFMALCFLISCKTQTSPKITSTEIKKYLMSTLTEFEETPQERRTIIKPSAIINTNTRGPQDIEEALNFIKEALNQATSQGRKIDADAKINGLTKDLNQQQISIMLKNIITILKIKKNIDNLLTQNNNIKENCYQIKYWTETITKNLETQLAVTINNYHKEIAKAIVENSSNDDIRHDIKKISNNSIKEIQEQLYLLTTTIKDIIQHLTLQEKKAFSLLQTLLKAMAHYTHEDFMKFIINIKLQGTREMIKNLAQAMQLKEEIDILITQIQDKQKVEQIQSQVKIAYITNYLATFNKPIITLHNFDETQKYITNTNPNDELQKIKAQAKKIKDEQSATQNP
ncbi:hypothetical protein BDCR2A_01186 [Borrelia duttonii CR2A]|uniref:Uncharacterized protein n=2 Tax=Borrelia duttonii TaxID=40834 RepID=W6TXX1_9SPIR|nr:hypothetical protein BDCR2A_01186 [Borrelia duttonii CR2A]